MTATLRTTAFVLLASLPVGIGSARAQQMEPPRFEQTEPPRVVPPPPPPPPRREPPPSAAPPARELPPAAPATPPSPTQWRQAPPAPPPREPAQPAPVPPPRQPPASVQAPPVPAPPRQPPASVQAPPARVQAPQSSPARSDGDDAIDDPKLWRRLGPRISVPGAPPPAVPPPPAPAPPRPRATARSAPTPAPAPLPPSPLPPPPPASAPVAAAEGDQTTLVRPYTPAREPTFEPTLPRLKLGLRRFDFVRIGASNTPDGVAAPQTFNSFSVDVYPVSRVVRIGLTSAFGWESGTFLTNGDYFATQTVSLGAQYRELGRVVPFAEAFMGVGYMRRVQFDRAIPTAFWNFGIDAGAEIYVARVGYLSLALGYMRPINGFARRQIFTSVFVDTWSVKIGIGI